MRNGKAPQEQLRLHRFVVILMMFVLLCAVFVARLVQMQLTDYAVTRSTVWRRQSGLSR